MSVGALARPLADAPLATEAGDFALLYSTLGYGSAATKRALVRPLPGRPGSALDAGRSRFRVLDGEGRGVHAGAPRSLGATFGIPLFELEFSTVRGPGRYRVEVELADGSGAPLATLRPAGPRGTGVIECRKSGARTSYYQGGRAPWTPGTPAA